LIQISLIVESIVVISILVFLSVRFRVLDWKGSITAAIIGLIIYLTIGRTGILVLSTFMFISGLATRFGYQYKKSIGVIESKTGIRGWRNVVGNGLIAAIIGVLSVCYLEQSEMLLAGFIGSVSAVFADTLATEIGLLYKGQTRLIIGFKKTSPGTPGGVTTYGYAGALSSSLFLIIVLTPFLINSKSLALWKLALIIIGSGVGGTTIDSIVGQLLQATYRCIRCGVVTEYPTHCDTRCEKIKGLSYFNNHVVNIVCSASGVLFAIALYELV